MSSDEIIKMVDEVIEDKPSKRELRQQKRQERKGNKRQWIEKYSDYYGEYPPYDLEDYKNLGRRHLVTELIVYALIVAFFAWGGYNLYYLGGVVRDELADNIIFLTLRSEYQELFLTYFWQVLLIIIGIYILSFMASYLVVRFFARLAWFFMYGSLILQITIAGILAWRTGWYSDFQYWYLFLIPIVLDLLVLTIWHKRFKKAIKFLKLSCLAVVKEKKLLLPQFTQTVWIFFYSLFYTIAAVGYVLKVTPIRSWVIDFNDTQYTITENWIFVAYSCLFVLLVYIAYFISVGMKQQMVHYWYRGDRLRYWRAFRIVRYRMWGILWYAVTTTAIHMLQYIKKAIKGEFAPKTLKQALTIAKTIKPQDIQKLRKKKVPIYERIWMGMNYFTLQAIILEDKNFVPAIWRSFVMISKNIPDLYIKESHVKNVITFMKWMMIVTSTLLGGILGAIIFYLLFGYEKDVLGVENWNWGVVLFMPIFAYIGGGVANLILNDLNTSYTTIMYIHTVDKINKKDGLGFTRFELKNPLSDKEMQEMQERKRKEIKEAKLKEEEKEEKKKDRNRRKFQRQGKEYVTGETEFPAIEPVIGGESGESETQKKDEYDDIMDSVKDTSNI